MDRAGAGHGGTLIGDHRQEQRMRDRGLVLEIIFINILSLARIDKRVTVSKMFRHAHKLRNSQGRASSSCRERSTARRVEDSMSEFMKNNRLYHYPNLLDFPLGSTSAQWSPSQRSLHSVLRLQKLNPLIDLSENRIGSLLRTLH